MKRLFAFAVGFLAGLDAVLLAREIAWRRTPEATDDEFDELVRDALRRNLGRGEW